jgi:hypothetical protein
MLVWFKSLECGHVAIQPRLVALIRKRTGTSTEICFSARPDDFVIVDAPFHVVEARLSTVDGLDGVGLQAIAAPD